ncbi:MAG: 4-(cytidine 5'-diphospho)-2-C-methyl-D-erythritol kinase [Gaiellaceae bacterium]
MSRTRAFAKVNLALVVGPLRSDGKHEVVTVLQAIELHDDVEVELAEELTVEGFDEDTLVRVALEALAGAASVPPAWRVQVEKRIPIAVGLGGGSSDAASALQLANELLAEPLVPEELHRLAARLGADVPFFLRRGSQLGSGDGAELVPIDLPTDFVLLLALPAGESKESTASVYRRFDERNGPEGFDERRDALLAALQGVTRPTDLARLPKNDLAASPLAGELEELGAFRADVSGAGPAVYGLFDAAEDAERAADALVGAEQTWVVRPVLDG